MLHSLKQMQDYKGQTMEIKTIKLQENGWKINGVTFISNIEKAKGRKEVLAWIKKGGIVEAQYSTKELTEQTKQKNKENKDLLISQSTAEVHTILYDIDEKSMDRMNRIVSLANAEYNYRVSVGETLASAYEASYKTQTVDWTGADDKPHKVMVESIVQALRAGMINMGEIWHGN